MASGDTLAEWSMNGAEFPTSSPACWSVSDQQPILEFDATTDETVFFSGLLPSAYSGGGVTLTLIWTSMSAISGDCAWFGRWDRQSIGQPLATTTFGTGVMQLAIAPGTTGNLVYSTIAFTSGAQMDDLLVHERFRLQVMRVASDVGDTMAGDAWLIAVVLKET